jgi:anthranilate phosphoribosyltransferase
MGFERVSTQDIKGGDTVESSAKIFMDVLNGEATDVQNNVVLCNSALAIKTIKPEASFADCYYEAEESLTSKKALNSFKQLLSC